MARNSLGTDQPRHGGNGYDPDVMLGYFGRVERLMNDLASERGSFMERCKSIRQDIGLVVQEAKDQHGIAKGAFRAVIKVHELEARADRVREDLELEVQESFDQIRFALGDLDGTPLGSAVLAKAAGDQPAAF